MTLSLSRYCAYFPFDIMHKLNGCTKKRRASDSVVVCFVFDVAIGIHNLNEFLNDVEAGEPTPLLAKFLW